jgi:hypothetical protein
VRAVEVQAWPVRVARREDREVTRGVAKNSMSFVAS